MSLAFFVFLLRRLARPANREKQAYLLLAFIGVNTVFLGLLFLDVSWLPTPRLLIVYLENTVLAIGLALLLQFAYHFPHADAGRKWEARVVLGLSVLYAFYEAQYAFYRYQLILTTATVDYRPAFADYLLIGLCLWTPVAFARQSLAADTRPLNWLQKLAVPESRDARTTRSFAFIFSLYFLLSIVNLLCGHSVISTSLYNIFLSVGALLTLWLFSTAYAAYLQEKISFIVRVTATTITLLLMLLGAFGWLMAPLYAGLFTPEIQPQQTIRFTPGAAGGYDLSIVPYHFETDYGERLPVTAAGSGRNYKVDFGFPFFGQNYSEIYVTSVGLIGMGAPLYHPNLQWDGADLPALMPLLVDLNPAGGGVYARADGERLIVTWDNLPALFQPIETFTFQAILYADGVFEFSYAKLPEQFTFALDASPSANLWLRGVSAGRLGAVTNVSDLSQPGQSGPNGVEQNFLLAFRQHLHALLIPIFVLVFAGSAFLLLAVPVLFQLTFSRPLGSLLRGVREMEAGNLNTQVTIYFHDEIGFLTQAFNRLVARLRGLVGDLEQQVARRTQELVQANSDLRAEMELRVAAQRQAIEQQRQLAAFEEREQMSRDLHDGLGQFIAYIGVQTQATRTMLSNGDYQAVEHSMARLGQVAEKSQIELRRFILGLRTPPAGEETSLLDSLKTYITEFHANTGIRVHLSLPDDFTLPALPPNVELQILHIIQESLVNVHKHAGVQRASVFFSLDERSLQIMISDEGAGFHMQQRKSDSSRHFGLAMMRERAQSVGGRLEVRSQPGVGTRVMVFVPILIPTRGQDVCDGLTSLRILLVDDSAIFTEGLTNLLAARGFIIVGVARDGNEALERALQLRPDIIVMDVMMPNCDGIEAIENIKSDLPEVKILVLTASEKENHLVEAIRKGASGYLLKGMDANEFCVQLGNLARGETILPPGLAAQIIGNPSAWVTTSGEAQGELTDRQQEILDLVAQGVTYKEIGLRLHLSERTIKYHMAQILETLQLKNRSQAIVYARKNRQQPGSGADRSGWGDARAI